MPLRFQLKIRLPVLSKATSRASNHPTARHPNTAAGPPFPGGFRVSISILHSRLTHVFRTCGLPRTMDTKCCGSKMLTPVAADAVRVSLLTCCSKSSSVLIAAAVDDEWLELETAIALPNGDAGSGQKQVERRRDVSPTAYLDFAPLARTPDRGQSRNVRWSSQDGVWMA